MDFYVLDQRRQSEGRPSGGENKAFDPSMASHFKLFCVMAMTKPYQCKPTKLNMKNHVNVEEWVALFAEVGLDEAKRKQWHKLFERRHPAGHQSFLEWLGFKPAEINQIRSQFQ